MNPYSWPLWLRRAYVLTFPISAPALFLLQGIYYIGLFFLLLLSLALLAILNLADLWRKE